MVEVFGKYLCLGGVRVSMGGGVGGGVTRGNEEAKYLVAIFCARC